MQSKAATVKAYLAELPADRRAEVEAVRAVMLQNLDKDYEEGMQYGMICYRVPHSIYPPGYHCNPKDPLPFAGLASQKNYLSVYLGLVYGDAPLAKWFAAEWKKSGKKLDMGKSCIRFKKAEDLALDVIGEAIRRVPAAEYIAYYETTLKDSRKKKPAGNSRGTGVSPVAANRTRKARTTK